MAVKQEIKCRWPLSHISIDVYGNIRPCCAWELRDYNKARPEQPAFNINRQPLREYLTSPFYVELKDQMLKNQWGLGCNDCIEEQKNGVEGTRESGLKFEYKTDFAIEDMEVKFGNLCNQGCIMCSPMNSSVLEQESIKYQTKKSNLVWHLDNKDKTGIDTIPWFENAERFREVVEWASRCKTVKFRGGEPTVNNYLQQFLDELSKLTTEVEIFINTNAHTFTEKLERSLGKFDNVWIELSIDGYGTLNEYVRWPNSWSKLESNVDRMLAMPNTRVSVSSTVQLMNVGEMEPLVLWTKQRDIRELLVNVVWYPDYFQPCLASERRKDAYRNMAEKHQSQQFDLKRILGAINKTFTADRQEQLMKNAYRSLDQFTVMRQLDWKDYVAEL
jgi:wyosine [tRNA(Phe)-imidazoG37] synthetase (radical SAM superfamily)